MRSAARPLFVTGAVVFALGAIYAISLLPFVRGDSGTQPLLDIWLNLIFKAGVVTVVALRGYYDRRLRAAWWCLSLGLLAAFLGSVGYYTHYRYLDPIPFPSWADAGFVGFYLLAYAAIVLMLRDRIWPFPRSMWLDGLVAGLTAAAFAAAFALEPALRAPDAPAATVAVTLGYVAADLVLVMFLAGALVLLGAGGRTWGWLAAGLLIFFLTDALYVNAVATGTYEAGDPLDIGWTVARLCYVVAALQAIGDAPAIRRDPRRLFVVPALCAVAALVLLYAGTRTELPPAATTLALLAVIAGLSRTVITFRDSRLLSTELRVARDEAERASRAKSEFVSGISHELRTPLNAILGFAQLLERGASGTRSRDQAARIITAGGHLTHLIDDLLDLGRIERGELHVALRPVRVTEVLREVVELVRPMVAERRLELEIDAHGAIHEHVMADPVRLNQVLFNLLSNAIKYNRPGGRIKISFEDGGDELRFVVSDTGVGIAEDALPRVFRPFDRLDAQLGTEEGTGLGLAISQGLVHAMRGDIEATSEVGRGTSFRFSLPRTAAPEGGIEPLPSGEPEAVWGDEEPLTGTVLQIEDNPANVELIESIFAEQAGVRLLTATNGETGLELAERFVPDVVLLDVNLPDLAAGEVLRRLKSLPATESASVVAVSADATAARREELLGQGADDYLTKPLDIDRFVTVVRKLLSQPAAARPG